MIEVLKALLRLLNRKCLPAIINETRIVCSFSNIHSNNECVFRDSISFLILYKIHRWSHPWLFKLGINSRRFDTPHHTKRALFVQVPEKPSNRNAPTSSYSK